MKEVDWSRVFFDLTEAPVIEWEESQWMYDRLEEFGGMCPAAIRMNRRMGDLEMKTETTKKGLLVRMVRHEPKTKEAET